MIENLAKHPLQPFSSSHSIFDVRLYFSRFFFFHLSLLQNALATESIHVVVAHIATDTLYALTYHSTYQEYKVNRNEGVNVVQKV